MKCNNCGGEMDLIEDPQAVFQKRIPFTQYDIVLLSWKRKEYICVPCALDENSQKHQYIYDSGFSDGYDKAIDDTK